MSEVNPLPLRSFQTASPKPAGYYDSERPDISALIPPHAYRILDIGYGGVLEHLRDPWTLLARLRPLLQREGVLIASVPNVANLTILLALSQGRWPYHDLESAKLLHRKLERLYGVGQIPPAADLWGFDLFLLDPHGQPYIPAPPAALASPGS